MVFFNYSTMQMAAKVVYYGPGLAGKTTNLHYIYAHTAVDSRGEMVSLETETDRTLFFDLLPIDVGTIAGFNTRIQLYTVPGQVIYDTTRKLVLKGVDGIVFVADSQRSMAQANIKSFHNLEENLAIYGLSVDTLPLVLQFNKRDLPDICSVKEMNQALNRGNWSWVESSAVKGVGVFETLKEISKLTLFALKRRLSPEQASNTPRPSSRPAQRVPDTGPVTSPPQPPQPSPQTVPQKARVPETVPGASPLQSAQPGPQKVPQKAPGGKSQSSRDYAGELEKLAQTFLRRKASAPPASPSTSNVTKESSEKVPASPRTTNSAGGIFICYRRSDSMDVAGRMHDRLVAHYSQERVFKDVDSIPLGVDFRKHLEEAVARASIVVVVIGRSWLRGKGAKSGNLFLNPRDFVRIEVELALRLNLPIIPVLVGGAKMPSEKDLPESLSDLAYRNGMELRPDPNFHKDMNRLIAGMDALLNAMKPSGK